MRAMQTTKGVYCKCAFVDWGHDKWVGLRTQENYCELDLGLYFIGSSHLPLLNREPIMTF